MDPLDSTTFDSLSLQYTPTGVVFGCANRDLGCIVTSTLDMTLEQVGTWIHWVGVIQSPSLNPGSGALFLYRNGLKITTLSNSNYEFLGTSDERLVLGNDVNLPFRLDEFKLWSTVLNDVQIQNGYLLNTWPSYGLQVSYTFSEQSGSFLHDSSGNGHHGMMMKPTFTTASTSSSSIFDFHWEHGFMKLCRKMSSHVIHKIEIFANTLITFNLQPSFSHEVFNYTATPMTDWKLQGGLPILDIQVKVHFTSDEHASNTLLLSGPSNSPNGDKGTPIFHTLVSGRSIHFNLSGLPTSKPVIQILSPNDGHIYTIGLKEFQDSSSASSSSASSRRCASHRVDNGHIVMAPAGSTKMVEITSSPLVNSPFTLDIHTHTHTHTRTR